MAQYRQQGTTNVIDETGKVVNNFGGNLDTLPIANSNLISSANLTPVVGTQITTPSPDTTNYSGTTDSITQGVMDTYKSLNETATKEQEAQQKSGQDIIGTMNTLLGKTADTQSAEEAAGVGKAKEAQGAYLKQLAELNAQASSLNREAKAIPLQVQEANRNTGATDRGIAPQEAGALRLNALKALSIGQQADIASAALTGSTIALQNAKDKAQQIVDLKYKPLEAELEIKKQQYELNKDVLSALDKKRTEALGIALKKEETALADKKAEEKAVNDLAFELQKNGAPQSVVNLALQAKTKQDIQKIPGVSNYLLSQTDKLDLQLKQKQIAKLNQELTTKNVDAGELVKINGTDYIRYKDGTISEPVLPGAGDIATVTSRLDNKIKTLDKLIKPSVGLATSAGSLRGAPIPFLAKNAINNWRADAINVVQKLTVDELGRVKSDGVTFGALSNGERQAVGDAATALSAAMIYTGSGDDRRPTGKFKMSEKKVIEEFKKIQDGYNLDFQRRTGISYSDYVVNPELIKTKAADDFIDDSINVLESNINYGNYPIN